MSASQELTPFEYLMAVDRKCVEIQGGLIQQETDASFSHGLAFKLGSHQYIIPIAEVHEVITITNYSDVPRSPNWLRGIANIRGNLITLLDMSQFIFGTVSKDEMRQNRALLVKNDSNFYGLIIESIIGMKSFNIEEGTDQVPETFNPEFVDHISAFYSLGDEWFAELSIQSLLQDEKFNRLIKPV